MFPADGYYCTQLMLTLTIHLLKTYFYSLYNREYFVEWCTKAEFTIWSFLFHQDPHYYSVQSLLEIQYINVFFFKYIEVFLIIINSCFLSICFFVLFAMSCNSMWDWPNICMTEIFFFFFHQTSSVFLFWAAAFRTTQGIFYTTHQVHPFIDTFIHWWQKLPCKVLIVHQK